MGASRPEPVGVVGAGAMGAPIVAHLAHAGRAVVVYDRDAGKAASAAGDPGARVAASLAEIGGECTAALILVDDDAAVLEVVDALLAAGTRLRVMAICSSVSPETIRTAAARADAHAVGVLDAAMVGGIRGVVAGSVTLLVGGDPTVLDSVRDVVEPWTGAVHHLGPLGAGQIVKSANNLIHWAQVCAIEEALRIVERAGLSVPAARRALCDGPADSRALHELEQMRLTWWQKDLVGYRALAEQVGAPHPVGDLCAEVMPGISVESLASLLDGNSEAHAAPESAAPSRRSQTGNGYSNGPTD